MSRMIVSSTLVICCALALMPLLVRPMAVHAESIEHAVPETTFRAKATPAAQVPAASIVMLADVR